MMFTCVPVQTLNAEEVTKQETVEQSDYKNPKLLFDTDLEKQSEQVEESEQEKNFSDKEEDSILQKQNETEAGDSLQGESSEELKSELNYLFVNKANVALEEKQRFVVSWGKENTSVDIMELIVENEQHERKKLETTKNVENVYLFEETFTKGIYHIAGLNVVSDGIEKEYTAKDLEIEAYFGVEKEYQGNEKSDYIQLESIADGDAPEVGANIVTIDDKGTEKTAATVKEALDEVKKERVAKVRSVAEDTRTEDLVVVLDPGHDSKHAGAQKNGVKEEVVSLKIAQYCKEELEKYSGVTVYLTREDAACPFPDSKNNIDDIIKRTDWAKTKGADVFISFHINSSTSSSANGAEVYYPKGDKDAEKLAQQILGELEDLGLHNRGEQESTGYAVVKHSVRNGFPGFIIEHAFVTNSSDVKWFQSETNLKKLGVADATGIAEHYGLAKAGNKVTVEEGTYVLENLSQSGKVVSVANSSMANQAKVNVATNQKSSSQRFEIRSAGNGYYYLIAEHSGKALDVRGGSSADGTAVQQYALNTSAAAQKWAFISAGNGNYYIQSALGTMMEIKGSAVQTGKPDKSMAQKWTLKKSDYRPVKDGTYTIHNKINQKQVLEVASASMKNGGNIQINATNNKSEQRFEVRYVGDGYYSIVSEQSGKALDVVSGKTANGTNLQQYAWNKNKPKAQLWKFVDAGNGYYYIRSKTGNVIDLSNKSAAKNSNVYMWGMTGTSTQQWKMTVSSYRPIEDGEYVIGNVKNSFSVMTADGKNVEIGTYNNSGNQKFKITYVSNGYYKIVLTSNGKVLDVANGSAENRANLQLYNANGTDAQLWKFVDAGNNAYYIRSKLGTTIDLVNGNIISGTNIQMYTTTESEAQKWVIDSELLSSSERPIEDGTYVIKNASNMQTAIDVEGGKEKNGGNIRLYKFNNSSSQRYEFYYVGDGYYRIMAERSGRALDVRGGSSKVGTNLQQYEWKNANAQLWKIIPAGSGNFYIQSKLGTVVDLNKNSAVSGANVQMNKKSNRTTQKWKIEKNEYRPFSNGTYSFRVASSKNQVLDIQNDSPKDGGNVWIYGGDGSTSQNFEVTYVKDGYYKIISKISGKALQYDSKNNGNKANVYQQTWTGKDEQLWKFVQGCGGGYFIKSKTGRVFDVENGKIAAKSNIQMYLMNGSNAQKWTLRKENEYQAAKITNGVYSIQSAAKKSYLLDVKNGETGNKANVQIDIQRDIDSQKFKITAVSDGYYKIASVKSGKVLDISNASMASGTNVQQYTWNGSNAQLWKFVDAGNGSYYIQSKLGTVLDIQGGKIVSKANVQAYNSNGSEAQKWKLAYDLKSLYKIMGTTSTTVDKMVRLYNSSKREYPYADNTDAPTIQQFCEIYLEEAEVEGIRGEVAFCQAMLETGYLKFGGDVKKEQYNFAGLGATGGGAQGATFPDIRTGIRAQIQHLKAYASKEELKQPCVDPRFQYVKRGTAEYVQWLGVQENPYGAGWATGADYGYKLLKLVEQLKAY